MESTTIVVTQAPYASERSFASASAKELFPAAVGPQTTRVFLLGVSSPCVSIVLRSTRVEDVRACPLDLGGDVLACRRVCRHVNGMAAPGLAYGCLTFLAGAVAVAYVDLLGSPDLAPVSGESILLDGPQDLQEPPLGHTPRYRLRKLCGLGAAPRGELEDVGRIKGAILDELQSLLVILLGLARVAHYYVR